MKLILHPGFAKCGSTSIQKALSLNEKHLNNQGFYLAREGFIRNFASKFSSTAKHLSVLNYFKYIWSDDRYEEFEKAIMALKDWAEKTGFLGVIISSENLSSKWCTIRNGTLHQILNSHFSEVRIVAYIRRQDDWMLSAWKQWQTDIKLSSNYQSSENFNLSENFYLFEIMARSAHLYSSIHDQEPIKSIRELAASDSGLFRNARHDLLSAKQRHKLLKHFEGDNRHLHEHFFSDENFEQLYPLPTMRETNEMVQLNQEIDNLKDIMAIQMELILALQRKSESKARQRNIFKRLL